MHTPRALLSRAVHFHYHLFSLLQPGLLSNVDLRLSGLLALFEDEGDRQVDLVTLDIAILDHHVHVLDMSALDISKGASGTFDGLVDRILEALVRDGTHLCYTRYGHEALLLFFGFP